MFNVNIFITQWVKKFYIVFYRWAGQRSSEPSPSYTHSCRPEYTLTCSWSRPTRKIIFGCQIFAIFLSLEYPKNNNIQMLSKRSCQILFLCWYPLKWMHSEHIHHHGQFSKGWHVKFKSEFKKNIFAFKKPHNCDIHLQVAHLRPAEQWCQDITCHVRQQFSASLGAAGRRDNFAFQPSLTLSHLVSILMDIAITLGLWQFFGVLMTLCPILH